MWAVSFLLITSMATGTRMLVNSAITSKETCVSSGLMLFPLKLSANPLLSLTKERFLSMYLCKILVRNVLSLGRCATGRYYGSEGDIRFMHFE